ncbi:lysozyme [Aethina tumida]|uniref:lysozyme n=1 Tax=Aethina tumida TaxID=116153 RepID=UPI00096ADED0|nr:lysozyme [Aethina tumida]
MIKYACVATVLLFSFLVHRGSADDVEVSQQCLSCICEAISSCNVTAGCTGNVCGAFRLSWGYWADAGKPTLSDDNPEAAEAYKNCALDANCASATVQGYMNKFQQDCNGDGKVDCDDYALIHIVGGYGCVGASLPDAHGKRYKQCKDILKF